MPLDQGGDAIDQAAAWAYLHNALLPIHAVWHTRVMYRKVLRRYAAEVWRCSFTQSSPQFDPRMTAF
jgi:hypothetical protein